MLHDSRLTPTRDTLKHETCAAEFPAQCVAALERVSALIAQQAAHEPPLRLSGNLEDFREAEEPTPVRLLRARRLLICALLAELRHERPPAPQDRAVRWEHRARSLAPARRKCSSLERIRAMSLSATAEATIPQGSLRLLARLPSCVSCCQHRGRVQACAGRAIRRWPFRCTYSLASGAAAGRCGCGGTAGVGCRERGFPAVASPPPG